MGRKDNNKKNLFVLRPQKRGGARTGCLLTNPPKKVDGRKKRGHPRKERTFEPGWRKEKGQKTLVGGKPRNLRQGDVRGAYCERKFVFSGVGTGKTE